MASRSLLIGCLGLAFLFLIALLEPLHATSCVHHPLLASEERVALAAKLDLEGLFGRTGDEGVTTGADYLSIIEILGMDFLFHIS